MSSLLTIDELNALPSLSDARVSPNGMHVAFIAWRPNPDHNLYRRAARTPVVQGAAKRELRHHMEEVVAWFDRWLFGKREVADRNVAR